MIVYLNDPKNSTRELLHLINNFSKLAGYKINASKSVAFIYSKDKQTEKEIKEMIDTLHNSHKQHKVSWGDSNQTSERPICQELQISEEGNRRRSQKMEKSSMLMDWQD